MAVSFILDNDIPYRIAEALAALGEDVTNVRKEFGPGAKDIDWVPEAARRGWVIITADNRMIRHGPEKQMLRRQKASVLIIQPFFHKRKLWDKAVWLIRRWLLIKGFAMGMAKGTVAKVQENGRCMVVKI